MRNVTFQVFLTCQNSPEICIFWKLFFQNIVIVAKGLKQGFESQDVAKFPFKFENSSQDGPTR